MKVSVKSEIELDTIFDALWRSQYLKPDSLILSNIEAHKYNLVWAIREKNEDLIDHHLKYMQAFIFEKQKREI